jgi:hypothetical protein
VSCRHAVGDGGAEVVEESWDIRAEVGECPGLCGPMENPDLLSCDGDFL